MLALAFISSRAKNMTRTLTIGVIWLLQLTFSTACAVAQANPEAKPKISFTFDDGSTSDFGTYKLETWNQLLLDNLKKHHLKAILFSSGKNKTTKKGKYVLSSWNNAGHLIANHTLS